MSFLRKNSMLLAFSAVSAIALAIGCSQSADDSDSSAADDTQGDAGDAGDAAPADAGPAVPASVVISQVYGAGGNSGALYLNDYVELFNVTDADIDISGMTVQYAAAAGNFSKLKNTATIPAGTAKLQPGQYFLLQFSSGGSTGQPLPHPDFAPDPLPDGGTPPDMLSMAKDAGKVALLKAGAPPLDGCGTATTPCVSPNILDLVGYGGASQFHGAPAPALGPSTAAVRWDDGCYTDPTREDFVAAPPAPHNSLSPKSLPCSQVDASAPPPPPALPDAGADGGSKADSGTKPPKGSSSSSGGHTTAGDDDDDTVTPPTPKGSSGSTSSTHGSSGSTTNGAKPPAIAATAPDCNMSPGQSGTTGLGAVFGLALVGAAMRRRKR